MTVKSWGREASRRYIAQVPTKMVRLLGGTARAGATVIADGARQRSISSEVSGSIKVRVLREETRVVAYIETRGKGSYLAPWLEYGTEPHFISISEVDRGGMTVGRINRLRKESLVIGGNFVGRTVQHPGAQPHPFLRVSLDLDRGEAINTARDYIRGRARPGAAEADGDAE